MAGKPTTIDEYLANVGEEKRCALEKLRKAIRAAAPQAEECISYQLAAFRQKKMLVGFGATSKHCAFYLFSGSLVEKFPKELQGYDTSKGTIRFSADKPLPATLVRKLVKARLAENAAEENPNVATKPPTTTKRTTKPLAAGSQKDGEVTAFLKVLDHPLKPLVQALRKIILGVSPKIQEGIKWNAPSFRTQEYFATFHLHAKDQVRLILHKGAKPKAASTKAKPIADPANLLHWLGKDRCMVTFKTAREVKSARVALESVLRAWIKQL